MKVGPEMLERVLELDKRYRSTWDAHAIAHVVKLSPTTVAKILREHRGPRPKREEPAHTRRTRFIRRDVMWSSDFTHIGWGWLLLRTLDEHSGYILGWDLVKSEDSIGVLEHGQSIVGSMERGPLVWKYDHGSGFISDVFQYFMEGEGIAPYPTAPRAPWTNGRTEREHQETHNWLRPLEGRELGKAELEREIGDGMLVRNYVKPRACLGFRKSAEVYFGKDAELEVDEEMRGWLAQEIINAKGALGADDPEEVYGIRKSKERVHRKAVKVALEKLGLYEEWDTAAGERPSEGVSVNRTGGK